MSETDRLIVRMQTRGRVTVPVAFRRRFGWDDGAEIGLEETARGVLIVPRSSVAPPSSAPREDPRAASDLLMRDLNAGAATSSPGVLTMLRLGDALRARLREVTPAASTP